MGGVCHMGVWFQSNGQGHPISRVYECEGKTYPYDIQIKLNDWRTDSVRYTAGGNTFDVTRKRQTDVKTDTQRSVSFRTTVTADDLKPNKIVLNKIKSHLASGAKVVILTHNSDFARPNGPKPAKGNCLIGRFLAKHLGHNEAHKIDIRVAKNPGAKSWHIKKLGIQEFHDDSLNVLKEVSRNAPEVTLYQVFPEDTGANCCRIYDRWENIFWNEDAKF